MSRRWLIAVSVAAHLCILTGVFVSGIWRLERLDAGRARIDIGSQPLPPPAPSGGPVAVAPRTPLTPKRHVVTERRQPPREVIPPPTVGPEIGTGSGSGSGSGASTSTGECVENCGEGPPADPVCGNSAVEAGEQCDDGNALDGDGCSATCRTEPRPPQTVGIIPSVLQGLRLSGQTQIHPGPTTQNQMMRDGVSRVDAVVKLCIDGAGSVASARMLRSTRYDAYDQVLLAAIRDWRYQPYTVNSKPVPACSTVAFVYTIH